MIEKNTLSVPDNWNEITIGQFQEISELQNEGVERTIDMISIFLNEDPELVRKIDVTTLTKLIGLLAWSNDMPSDAIYKPIITIGEEQYGLISKFQSLSNGEWFDLEHYIKDGPIKNLHLIMSILYRPLITAFNDRDRIINEYDSNMLPIQADIFKSKVMVTDVYGVLVFFSLIEKSFLKIMDHYLLEQKMMMTI